MKIHFKNRIVFPSGVELPAGTQDLPESLRPDVEALIKQDPSLAQILDATPAPPAPSEPSEAQVEAALNVLEAVAHHTHSQE